MNVSSAPKAAVRLTAPNVILEITKRTIGLTRTLLLYRSLQILASPLLISYFIWRIAKRRDYLSGFTERLGWLPQPFSRTPPESIWLHAVSVGEVASSIPLIKAIRARHPDIPFYLSTSTIAGRAVAERDASPLVNGVFLSPIDFVSCVRRVLRTIRPSLLLILETEIWPNLLYEAKLCGASVVVLNGRISDRTWPQYRKWKLLFAPILRLPDLVVVQSQEDNARYLELGVPAARLRIEANLKYDTTAASAPLEIDTFGAHQIWVAASTVGPNEKGSLVAHQIDEDDLVLDAFAQLAAEFPKLLLIVAPRQPARFDEVAKKLRVRQLSFRRRSGKGEIASGALKLPGVLLLDTMGELARIYRLADAVFVGGSLAPRGGHNIIEPAAAGSAVVIGPNMQNFASITSDFLQAKAVVQIPSSAHLVPAVRSLLLNRGLARSVGERAAAVVRQKTGVSDRIIDELLPAQMLGRFQRPRNLWVRIVFSGLARLWQKGGEVKRRRSEQYASTAQPLQSPVISIGGISVGGSGKTPFTSYLAKKLCDHGWSPAILTRGYRRASKEAVLAFPPGAVVPAARTGDEAQVFLRAANAPVGIGSNRYQVARFVQDKFPDTDIFLLDDGFQHALVKRQVDIVLIDGLDPLGGNEVVPVGHLREPLEALRRATIFVVTRCESESRFRAIAEVLRSLNPEAPSFRTTTRSLGWRRLDGSEVLDLPGTKAAAFCGLGNPQSFWRTLDSLGVDAVIRRPFRDHHRYTSDELKRLESKARTLSADCLVTTEKDWVNLPPEAQVIFGPSRLFWLEIAFDLENEMEFFLRSKDANGSRRAVSPVPITWNSFAIVRVYRSCSFQAPKFPPNSSPSTTA